MQLDYRSSSSTTRFDAPNVDMLSTCLLSDVFRTEGCLAGLNVGAMVCMLTQGDGWILKAL